MKLLRKRIQFISAFLLLNFLLDVFFPAVSYALTAGPTAPEYSSFEPVDTDQMVDLNTGDFTYNLPILDVPGPSGGYPMSLSYHAGIRPGEEASWVGLGWTLNPGAINRSISGYPDDWKNENQFIKQFWSGGKTTVKRYGLGASFNIGVVNVGLGAGTTKYEDTYRGSATGYDFGASVGVGFGDTPFSFGSSIGISYDPFYGSSITMSTGVGVSGSSGGDNQGVSASAQISSTVVLTSKGAKGGYGIDTKLSTSHTSVGASISSMGGKTSSSVSLGARTYRSSHLHTSGNTWNKSTTKVDFGMVIQYRYQVNTYGMDEHQNDNVNGSLYPENGSLTAGEDFDHVDYDVNDLFEVYDELNTDIDFPQFGLGYERMLGGAVASYDSYYVSAQGMGGAIQPYNYLTTLKRQNKKNQWDNYQLKQYIGGIEDNQETKKIPFEFMGGFSNRYVYDQDNSRAFEAGTNSDPLKYSFDGTEIESDPDYSFSTIDNDLNKREKVEWVTNEDIIGNPNIYGLPSDEQSGFSRGDAPEDQIGAFIMTNATGVKYYYGLPVYASNEVNRQENINQIAEGKIYNTTYKEAKYAYNWLLTGLTGPDYVDRGEGPDFSEPNGILDEHDWGYWVKFNYGKWTDSYRWRTPGTGYYEDLDTEFKNASAGVKELYYLDAVQTATHTALFVKSVRRDAKSVSLSNELLQAVNKLEEGSYEPTEMDDSSFETEDVSCDITYGYNTTTDGNGTTTPYNSVYFNPAIITAPKQPSKPAVSATKSFSTSYRSIPSLKLDKVILVKNDQLDELEMDISSIKEVDNSLDEATSFEVNCSGDPGLCAGVDTGLDPDQISAFSIKDVFRAFPDYWYKGTNIIHSNDISDELIEASLKVIEFDTNYDLAPNTTNSFLSDSDDKDGKLTLNGIEIKGKGGVSMMPRTIFQYDKNPNADEQAKDYWGYYKSDYRSHVADANLKYRTTERSAQNVDAWSMTGIISPLGAKVEIDYSSDEFSEVILENKVNYRITNLESHESLPNEYKITLDGDLGDLHDYFEEGDEFETFFVTSEAFIRDYDAVACTDPKHFKLEKLNYFYNQAEVIHVNSSYIIVNASSLTLPDGSVSNPFVGHLPNVIRTLGTPPDSGKADEYCPCTFNGGDDGETKEFTDFLGGEIYADPKESTFGGGLKVDKIKITSDTQESELLYSYGRNGSSSGQTSSVPFFINSFKINYPDHYYRSVEGWYQGDPSDDKGVEEACNTGSLFNIALNNAEVFFLGPDLFNFILLIYDDFNLYGDAVKSILDLDISSNEEFMRYKQQQVWGDFIAKSKMSQPKVRYNYVEVREKVIRDGSEKTKDSYSAYTFNGDDPKYYEVSSVAAKDVLEDVGETSNDEEYRNVYKRRIAINSLGGVAGTLRNYSKYGTNGRLITSTDYNYLHDQVDDDEDFFESYAALVHERLGNQGVINEVFVNGKLVPFEKVDYEDDDEDKERYNFDIQGQVLKRASYPMIQLGMEKTDYVSGHKVSSENLAYDFYTGELIKSMAKDADGMTTVLETLPAYKQDQYTDMGPEGNHMLTQTAATYTYKVDPDNIDDRLAILGADIQTWNDEWNYRESDGTWVYTDASQDEHPVWRKDRSYSYVATPDNSELTGDGLVEYTSVHHPSFDSWTSHQTSDEIYWQKNAEITLYDRYSHALEAEDLNGNYTATKMDAKLEKVLATVANATFDEFAYSGAEDQPIGVQGQNFGGAVQRGWASKVHKDDHESHTGDYSLTIGTNGQSTFLYRIDSDSKFDRNKTYRLSVWVHEDNKENFELYVKNEGTTAFSLSGDQLKESSKAGNWYLAELTCSFTGMIGDIQVGCMVTGNANIYLDDFRMHPIDAIITSYVYNEYDELAHVLDNNNLYTHYKYDAAGRLESTHRESFKYGIQQISEHKVEYSRTDLYDNIK